jgi:hypothetical protein
LFFHRLLAAGFEALPEPIKEVAAGLILGVPMFIAAATAFKFLNEVILTGMGTLRNMSGILGIVTKAVMTFRDAEELVATEGTKVAAGTAAALAAMIVVFMAALSLAGTGRAWSCERQTAVPRSSIREPRRPRREFQLLRVVAHHADVGVIEARRRFGFDLQCQLHLRAGASLQFHNDRVQDGVKRLHGPVYVDLDRAIEPARSGKSVRVARSQPGSSLTGQEIVLHQIGDAPGP